MGRNRDSIRHQSWQEPCDRVILDDGDTWGLIPGSTVIIDGREIDLQHIVDFWQQHHKDTA